MNVEKNVLNSKREIVNQKIKNRTYLDTIEKRKLITLNLTDRSQPILAHLIEKYIYFFNSNLLNSKGEFYQSYDDIALGIISKLSNHLMKKSLDELTEKGYITRVLKTPEGVKTNIPKYHFILNYDKLNEILISTEEFNLPNHKKYEIQQDIKYKATPTKPVVKPKEKPTDEFVGLNTVESIQEPTENKEPLKSSLNSYEDIRRDLDENLETKTNKQKTKKEMRNEKNLEMCEEAKLLTEYKDKINLKNIFNDLDLTVEIVNYLYSGEYTEGVDIKMDDKKASIDVIINQKINPLRGIPMVFT